MDSNGITIKAGSRINKTLKFPAMSMYIQQLRCNEKYVDQNGELLTDITFMNPTQAALFVTGRSVNGYIAWRVNDKISLKTYRELSETERSKFECLD